MKEAAGLAALGMWLMTGWWPALAVVLAMVVLVNLPRRPPRKAAPPGKQRIICIDGQWYTYAGSSLVAVPGLASSPAMDAGQPPAVSREARYPVTGSPVLLKGGAASAGQATVETYSGYGSCGIPGHPAGPHGGHPAHVPGRICGSCGRNYFAQDCPRWPEEAR